MRSRWAAAVVLLASVLLLHLCSPARAAGPPTDVTPSVVTTAEAAPADMTTADVTTAGEPSAVTAPHDAPVPRVQPVALVQPAEPAGPAEPAHPHLGTPAPGAPDASLRHPLARAPRAFGPAGVQHPTAGTPATTTAPNRSAQPTHPSGPPPDAPPLAAGELRTVRC